MSEWLRAYREAGEIQRLFMQADLLDFIGIAITILGGSAILIWVAVLVFSA